MNKLSRLTALLLALIMLLGSGSLAEGGLPIGGASGLTSDDWADLVDAAEDKLFYTDEGDTGKEITPEAPEQPENPASYPYTDIEELTLVQSETTAEASITASGAAILTHEAAGQWQIAIGGVWANLYGETGSTLTVTGAMMNGRTSAGIRKALGDKNAETGEYAAYTQTAVINLIEAAPAMFSVSRDATDMAASDANDGIMTLELANQENMVIVQVIYRIKGTDQPVADAYIGQIAKGSALNTSLTLPRVTGYLAQACAVEPAVLVDKNITTFTAQTADAAGSLTINVTQELSQQDITIYVDYEPAEVTFTVKHMQQNITDDDYTEVETERQTLTGMTGAQVGGTLAKTYEGFSAIWYDPTTVIAADGSTVVEIRYNREYYLLTFDLGGGYGVEPIFAKFGTPVDDVGTPSRAGYAFGGWSLDGVNKEDLPSAIPAKDSEYKALWTPVDTTFIVAYWLDDPNKLDDEGNPVYNFWGSYEEKANSGEIVQGATYQNYPEEVADKLDKHEKRYSKYHHADENVPIKGDGNTVVNVYYHRNEYTLKFYYAMDDTDGTHYVVGGSTYFFGKPDGNTGTVDTTEVDTNDELDLLERYFVGDGSYKTGPGAKGQVAAVPQLKESEKENYTVSSSVFHDRTYYYIAFSAKYGADISEMWPVDVFQTVTRIVPADEEDASPSWKSVEAAVSAWNGEHNVWYSQHNTNQTIKGAYSQLDYKLLWDDGADCYKQHEFGESDTVAYLCFWENGANIWWSIPELYRYNVYVELFEGEDANGAPTREREGKTYYLRQQYDTVDDSSVNAQTPSAYTGLTHIGTDSNDLTVRDADDKVIIDAATNPILYIDGKLVYAEAYDVFFYYTRNTYDLVFESYTDSHKVLDIPFGSDISGYEWLPSDDPTDEGALPYPSKQEAGALEFKGWYTTPKFIDGTEFKFDTTTMPAHDVALYARWEPVKHDVQFWIDEKSVGSEDASKKVAYFENITHGMTVGNAYSGKENYVDPEEYLNQHQEYKDYTFAGWYFIDEDGTENRFDIKNTPINSDVDIYAKWTSDTPVEFTFKYQDEKGNQLAEDYTGLALPFTPVTMSAKIGTELTLVPADKALSYIPAVSSHTLNIDVDPAKNVFVFTYSLPGTVKYTVQYLAAKTEVIDGKTVLVPDENTDPLWPEKIGETPNAIVTENYMPVLGYMPQATQLRLIVSTEEENVIQFLYLPNLKEEAPYNVSHYLVDYERNEYLYASEMNKTGKINERVTVDKLKEADIPGYTFAKAEVVVPTEQEDGSWKDVRTAIPAELITVDQVQYVLPTAGMHVYLYYEPIKYPFKVQYINATTNVKIKDDKIAAVDEYMPYGSTLNTADYVVEIEDYRFVRFDPATWTVDVEQNNSDPTVNVLTIYYQLDVADITITKNIAVSTEKDAPQPTPEELATAFTFKVSLTHATKQQTSVSVTLPETGKQSMNLKDGVLTFTLQNGQSATIHDLWGGTEYEVIETEEAKFKTSYDSYYKGVLSSLDVYTVVTNTFPKYVGELTINKAGMQDDKESAIVKADVGGVVYYLVLNKTNGYTATISGIKPGTSYNVTEMNDWTWQYSSTITGGSGTLTENQATATVVITNTKTTDKWLHDESHVENNFDTGESTGVNQ